MGRRKLDPARKKSEAFCVRFEPSRMALIESARKQLGLATVVEYIRYLVWQDVELRTGVDLSPKPPPPPSGD